MAAAPSAHIVDHGSGHDYVAERDDLSRLP
jgi:hypothetical protein